MAIDLGATPRVIGRLERGLPKSVAPAFEDLKDRLRQDPRFARPDKREIWTKPFPEIPNHRHADLPGAWRASWTVQNIDGGRRERVTILFVGTHKEYDRLYGFQTS
jgi:hypothetical protein